MKYFIYILLLIGSSSIAAGQHSIDHKLAAKQPIWIAMMDDTNANYLQAVEAFDIYFAHHQKPEGESDMDIKKVTKNKKRFTKREMREAHEEAYLRMQVKKFAWWKIKVEPYVQEDGRILTPTERILLNNNK
jgi:hypothetical protein